MDNSKILDLLKELASLEKLKKEIELEIDGIKDSIKADMISKDIDSLKTLDFSITYKSVSSSRFDSTALKKDFPEMYSEFLKTTVSNRFTWKIA